LDKVVHFEIPVDNLERAKKFYKSAFDWGMNPMPEMEYTLLGTVEVDEKTQMPKEAGAINGGMTQRDDTIKNPVITISVEDIDAAMKKIEGLGGKIVQGKMEVPNMGITAYFQDTEGNIMGLFQVLRKP
jgi:predicted enzyme related to lactoylglutathione lyase